MLHPACWKDLVAAGLVCPNDAAVGLDQLLHLAVARETHTVLAHQEDGWVAGSPPDRNTPACATPEEAVAQWLLVLARSLSAHRLLLAGDPLEVLEMPTRVRYGLVRHGISTVGDLARQTPASLQRLVGLGPKALAAIEAALERDGLAFGTPASDPLDPPLTTPPGSGS
jgi:hypothetical protein